MKKIVNGEFMSLTLDASDLRPGWLREEIWQAAKAAGASRISVGIADGVVEIPDCAFESIDRIERVFLPDSVTRIGELAFSQCTDLTILKIGSGLVEIGRGSFGGCDSLRFEIDCRNQKFKVINGMLIDKAENIVVKCSDPESEMSVPDGVVTIADSAFAGRENIKSVRLPESLKMIGEFAFSGCVNLEEVNLPRGLVGLGYSAFSGCARRKEIFIPDGVRDLDALDLHCCTEISDIRIATTHPDYVARDGVIYSKNGQEAVFGVPSLREVKLSKGVMVIRDRAFCECRNLWKISLPEGLTKIGLYGLGGTFKSLRLPATLEEFDRLSVRDATGLARLTVTKGSRKFMARRGVLYSADGQRLLFVCPKAGPKVAVAASVKSITKNLFRDAKDIRTVVMHNGVEEIQEESFYGSGIQTVIIPKTVKRIGYGAFRDCQQLESVNVRAGIDELPDYVFGGCLSLKEFTIPRSVRRISTFAFDGCHGIKLNLGKNVSAEMVASLRRVQAGAFSVCDKHPSLSVSNGAVYSKDGKTLLMWPKATQPRELILPDGIETIGYGAVAYAREIQSVILPRTLKRIEAYAFSNCDSLRNVVVNENLTFVGEKAFAGCREELGVVEPFHRGK